MSNLNEFADCDEQRLREVLVEVIAEHRQQSSHQMFDCRMLLRDMVWRLAGTGSNEWEAIFQQLPVSNTSVVIPKPSAHRQPRGARKFNTIVWGLVAQGLAYPIIQEDHVRYLCLTTAGERMVDGAEPSPYSPRFIARFKERCPSAASEVVARLEDAVSCLEHYVPRAAVVMTGLAFETTIRAAAEVVKPSAKNKQARDKRAGRGVRLEDE